MFWGDSGVNWGDRSSAVAEGELKDSADRRVNPRSCHEKTGLSLRGPASKHRWGPGDIMSRLPCNHHKNPSSAGQTALCTLRFLDPQPPTHPTPRASSPREHRTPRGPGASRGFLTESTHAKRRNSIADAVANFS